MKLVLGKLDYSPEAMRRTHERTAFLFTGNSTIKTNGALVMGRGAALEVRDAYPGIDHALGKKIEPYHNRYVETSHMNFPPPIGQTAYGVLWAATRTPCNILTEPMPMAARDWMKPGPETFSYTTLHRPLAVFQVKFFFRDNARLDLIEYSAFLLGELADRHPDWNYVMNFPGIGAGHLTEDAVMPILSKHLPDNVVLHK